MTLLLGAGLKVLPITDAQGRAEGAAHHRRPGAACSCIPCAFIWSSVGQITFSSVLNIHAFSWELLFLINYLACSALYLSPKEAPSYIERVAEMNSLAYGGKFRELKSQRRDI